jgi:chromosome partitioning protein
MICIAVVNSKGGTGKTTLAAALAVRAAKDSKRVAMVDLDPQHSLAEWFNMRAGASDNPRMFADEDRADDARVKLDRDGWDWCFMDGPPGALNKLKEMVAAADFAVIPVKASGLDLLATVEAVAVARKAGVGHFAVLNDCGRNRLPKEVRGTLEANDVPVADTEIAHRISHVTAMSSGKTAAEARDSAAADEIDALWAEVRAAVNKVARARTKQGRR